jgi:putative ABC transport system permease protein
VYSVLAYAVRQRTRELGIRMSLGAQRSGLFWYVVRWALPPALAGLLIGLGVSYAFAEVAAAYVYEIQPRDAVTYLFATLFLLTVLLVGAAIPAIRAARLDPTRALRYE